MNDTMTFEDLVANFPRAKRKSKGLPSDSTAASERKVLLALTEPEFFVPPELASEENMSSNPLFWLISAPAAVGKSLLAQALAYKISLLGRQVLYVPLRGSTIGDNFFSGLMGSVFPSPGKSTIMESVRSGNTIILFDGYDELSMTEEQSRLNERFINEIRQELVLDEAVNPKEFPSVIILFRTAIMGLGIFDSILEYSTQFHLLYFSEEKQSEFLASYVKWKHPASFDYHQPCAEFLSVLRERLSKSDDDNAQSFFGHAPVLMALGDLILEELEEETSNIQRLAHEIINKEFQADKWGVLLVNHIIHRLLEREVPKFPYNIFTVNAVTSFEPYPVELQNVLLSRIFRARVEKINSEQAVNELAIEECNRRIAKDSEMNKLQPDDRERLKQQYLEELLQKFQQHPFVDTKEHEIIFSNPIYEEKYLAEYILKCKDEDLPEVFNVFQAPSFYLGQFLLDSIPGRNLKERQGLIFYILRSLSMASHNDFETQMTWARDRWEVSVETGGIQVKPFYFNDAILILITPDEQILDNLIVDGQEDAMVSIQVSGANSYKKQITLSQVSIQAMEIEILATNLSCSAVRLSGQIIRFGDSVESIDGIDSLSVIGSIEASDYIKRKYGDAFKELDVTLANEKEILQKKLNQILAWFRKRGAKDYAIFNKRFDTVVLKGYQDKSAIEVTGFLRDEGILFNRDLMVVLDQDKLAQYGIYYAKQNQLNFGDEFDDLVKNWVEYKSDLA
ncbi:MAG: hypothetical protein J3T61_02790 [Candidatus Brocadiales bacterium]|nr:hypothetical protein [Candidatus Bathyanammoxibius sp.]